MPKEVHVFVEISGEDCYFDGGQVAPSIKGQRLFWGPGVGRRHLVAELPDATVFVCAPRNLQGFLHPASTHETVQEAMEALPAALKHLDGKLCRHEKAENHIYALSSSLPMTAKSVKRFGKAVQHIDFKFAPEEVQWAEDELERTLLSLYAEDPQLQWLRTRGAL